MTTLFVINYDKNHNGTITETVRPENAWVYAEPPSKITATRKWDGMAVLITTEGKVYRRWEYRPVKSPKKPPRIVPEGVIPCGETDPNTGKRMYWVRVLETLSANGGNSMDRVIIDIVVDQNFTFPEQDTTYELIGAKLKSRYGKQNAENVAGHRLVKHGCPAVNVINTIGEAPNWSFNGLKTYISNPDNDIEGIVFHHEDGRMCKLRKHDFGIVR